MDNKELTLIKEHIATFKSDATYNPISTRMLNKLVEAVEEAQADNAVLMEGLAEIYRACQIGYMQDFEQAVKTAGYLLHENSPGKDILIELNMLRETNKAYREGI